MYKVTVFGLLVNPCPFPFFFTNLLSNLSFVSLLVESLLTNHSVVFSIPRSSVTIWFIEVASQYTTQSFSKPHFCLIPTNHARTK